MFDVLVSSPVRRRKVSNGDPIGSALRSGCFGYYKLDSNYLDSTSHHNHLVAEHWDWNNLEYIVDTDGVSFVSAKINDGVQFVGGSTGEGSNGTATLQSASKDFMPSGSFTWAFWCKSTNLPESNISDILGRSDPDEGENFQYFVLIEGSLSPENPSKLVLAYNNTNQIIGDVFGDDWVFVIVEFDDDLQTMSLYMDNILVGQDTDVVAIVPDVENTRLCFGGDLAGNYAGDKIIDEAGYWKRVLTSEEMDYLFNSGDGRSLFA